MAVVRFTPNFKKTDIRDFVSKKIKDLESVILDQIIAVAEQFVADARTVNTYKDRTSNLRGSIGYVILKDGQEIFGNFEGVQTGQTEARQFIKDIQGNYPKGFILIVVAGMNYGAAVEAKGYDVITGSSQVAEVHIKRSFDRLKDQLSKVS